MSANLEDPPESNGQRKFPLKSVETPTSPLVILNTLKPILDRRSISAEEATSMGFELHDPARIDAIAGTKRPTPSWIHGAYLPYWDIDASPLYATDGKPFCRWRYEGSPLPEIQVGNKRKIQRYTQRAGSGIAAYLPMFGGLLWVEIAHAPEEYEIWITEGEYKSICGVQNGLITIGLGGVNSIREKSGELVRPLNKFVWVRRKVFIVFDADKKCSAEKPYNDDVEKAATRLAEELSSKGATVYIVYIAKTPTFAKARESDPEAKMGMDDFFHAGGGAQELADTAKQYAGNPEYARLLREYAVFTGKNPHILRLADGVPYSTNSFIKTLESNALQVVITDKGIAKVIKLASKLVDDRNRLEVSQYVFAPQDPPGYNEQTTQYNVWTGWPERLAVSEARAAEIIAIWHKFINGLLGEEPARYIEKWAAHMVQRPGEKTSIAILLASALNGIGKSLLGEIIRGIVGVAHSLFIELASTGEKFNAVMNRRLFIQIDEADGTFAGMESRLKNLITADTMLIEYKNIDSYPVDNLMRLFLTSNSSYPIRLESENRRFYVPGSPLTERDSRGEWGKWVGDVVAKVLKSEEGLSALFHHLSQGVDLSNWNPTARVPVTDAMLDMVDASRTKSKTEANQLWEAAKEDPFRYWVLKDSFTSADAKIWGDFKNIVKAKGGQILAHQFKVKGANNRCLVVDLTGRMPRHMPPSEDRWHLKNTEQGLTGEQCAAAFERAKQAWSELQFSMAGGVRSDKL